MLSQIIGIAVIITGLFTVLKPQKQEINQTKHR